MVKSTESRSIASIKAGLWYTVCNFLFKGMAFITTPIFTRLLSKGEVGSFSNMTSWISILLVVTSMDLAQSVIRSKLEHEDDIDCYTFSCLALTSLVTIACYGIVCLFPGFFSDFFQMDIKYIHMMFVYLLASPAYSMYITQQRAFYKYKSYVLMTAISMVASTGLSLALVLLMNDKLMGRFVGYYLPQITLGLTLYIFIFSRGKQVKLEYWKYACVLCLPLVPHALSLHLLSSSDKIIITDICGAEYTAIYSVAYSCYHVVTILFDSMNKAWAPWLLESLHRKTYDEIKKNSKPYILAFAAMSTGVLLLAPEIILILGGRQYSDAIYCMPPLIASCLIQFIYTMYVNIEFYNKKTFGVAGATVIATGVNIVLNLLLIPVWPERGYVVAAYTTLTGYFILFVLHYYMVKRLGMAYVYDTKYNLFIISAFAVFAFMINVLYRFYLLRYVITLAYGLLILCVLYKNKDEILNVLHHRK